MAPMTMGQKALIPGIGIRRSLGTTGIILTTMTIIIMVIQMSTPGRQILLTTLIAVTRTTITRASINGSAFCPAGLPPPFRGRARGSPPLHFC